MIVLVGEVGFRRNLERLLKSGFNNNPNNAKPEKAKRQFRRREMASTPPRLLKRPKLESGGDDNGDGDTTVQEQEANLLTLIDHCYNEVEHLQRRMAHFPPQVQSFTFPSLS